MKKVQLPDPSKRLQFRFQDKPLLIGGLAMEYYGLRKAGRDIDFVLSRRDHARLRRKFDRQGMKYLKGRNKPGYKTTPEFVDLYGDQGLLFQEFELWTCILRFDYEYLSEGAVEEKTLRVASLEKLLLLKALVPQKRKYRRDVELIGRRIIARQYEG